MNCILCNRTFSEGWAARVSEGRPPNTPNRWRTVGEVCDICYPLWNKIEPKIKKWEVQE